MTDMTPDELRKMVMDAPERITPEIARSEIDCLVVAEILRDFASTFMDAYPDHILARAVGPEQTLIGLAIKRGHLVRADIHAAALDREAAMKAEIERLRAENDLWRRNQKVIQDAIRQAFPVGPPFELPNWPYGDAALTPEPEGGAG